MANPRVDYDTIAASYDRRYAANALEGVADALRSLAVRLRARRILEAGCGTGHWLADLGAVAEACGIDRSFAMLQQAHLRHGLKLLACATAECLPFPDACFDLVYCVNALHHFPDQQAFVRAARRALAPGGALAIIGLDPHAGTDRWHIYDYFPETRVNDLQRYPSGAMLRAWMSEAGLTTEEPRAVACIRIEHQGRAVLGDPFLEKSATSQLAMLNDEAYAAGMRRVEEALAAAEAIGRQVSFPVDLTSVILTGYLP